MKEGNELSELLSSFFVRKMKSVILRYFINWFIDVQYSVVIMYKEGGATMPVIKPITDYVIQMKYLNYVINSSSQFSLQKMVMEIW